MKFKLLILLLVTACSFMGCSDDDDENTVKPETPEEIRYYVKYEYDVFANSNHVPQTVTCMTEKGEVEMKILASKWSAVYGPFKKGDKVYMTVEMPYVPNYYESSIRLSVSINNEPFCLKKEVREIQVKELTTEYTIDF